jgi:tol-pal system protein YbgF
MKFSPQARAHRCLRTGMGVAFLCFAVVAAQPAMGQTVRLPDQVAQMGSQSGNAVVRLSVRITQLEGEIRRLTGQNEELSYRLRQLQANFDKVSGDLALRLKALEGGGKPALSANADTAPTESGAPKTNSAAASALQTLPGAEKGVRVLGTVRSGKAGGAQQAALAMPKPSVALKETPEQKYDRAHSLIVKQRKYGEAERVLRSFIDENQKHKLTPNAHYWLGRTFFVRGDFENAAFAFAEGFQKFPKSKKAPANLLNLGMSLSRLGKNREACTTYTRLLRTYRDAEDSVKRRVTRERQRAKCRRR